MKDYYFRFCANVSCGYVANSSEIATILNAFSQSLERNENLSSLVKGPQEKLPIRKFYVLVVQRRQRKTGRKACIIMQVQLIA